MYVKEGRIQIYTKIGLTVEFCGNGLIISFFFVHILHKLGGTVMFLAKIWELQCYFFSLNRSVERNNFSFMNHMRTPDFMKPTFRRPLLPTTQSPRNFTVKDS